MSCYQGKKDEKKCIVLKDEYIDEFIDRLKI